MHLVPASEIAQIRQIIEDNIGALMLLQEGHYNEAEKIQIFITCCRTLGRVILWGTTISSFQLWWLIYRCSLGHDFDVNIAIDYLILFSCAILEEFTFYEVKIYQQNLVKAEVEAESDE